MSSLEICTGGEPRLTVPGRGVVTIEDMAVVTRRGAAWLSRPQKDLILIRPEVLSRAERGIPSS